MTESFEDITKNDSFLAVVENTSAFCFSCRPHNTAEGSTDNQDSSIGRRRGRIVRKIEIPSIVTASIGLN